MTAVGREACPACPKTDTLPTSTDTQSGNGSAYTRVSTVTQTLDQQNQALAGAGVSKTFSDTMSGARDDRPGHGDGEPPIRTTEPRSRSRARFSERFAALSDPPIEVVEIPYEGTVLPGYFCATR